MAPPSCKNQRASKGLPVPPAPLLDQERFIDPLLWGLHFDQYEHRNVVKGRSIGNMSFIHVHFVHIHCLRVPLYHPVSITHHILINHLPPTFDRPSTEHLDPIYFRNQFALIPDSFQHSPLPPTSLTRAGFFPTESAYPSSWATSLSQANYFKTKARKFPFLWSITTFSTASTPTMIYFDSYPWQCFW